MTSRRKFLKSASLVALASQWSSCLGNMVFANTANIDGVDWEEVRNQFPIVKWDKLHLNSGSAGVMPTVVSNHLKELTDVMNQMAPYEAWGSWQDSMQNTRSRLAQMINVHTEEIQLVRNTTEALNIIIYGLRLAPSDEVLLCEHDYPYAINAWKNRESRDNLKLQILKFQLPDADDQILAAYAAAITSRTKVMHVTYMTHRQGQIMPVAKLVQLAKEHDIQVVVDGAHTLAHIPLDISVLGCDYYATSLHKWLNAPHGTGLLYVKEERVADLMPHPSSNQPDDTIQKYAHLGTRAYQQEVGISTALDFHGLIGQDRKYNRLQELKHYWTGQLLDNSRIKWHTDLSDDKSCAVATIGIKGMPTSSILKSLDQDHNIHAKSVGGSWGSGVRISPNIFTNFKDLDYLVSAITEISKL
jgi:selenocysteine lyase/cysteine desulfurase